MSHTLLLEPATTSGTTYRPCFSNGLFALPQAGSKSTALLCASLLQRSQSIKNDQWCKKLLAKEVLLTSHDLLVSLRAAEHIRELAFSWIWVSVMGQIRWQHSFLFQTAILNVLILDSRFLTSCLGRPKNELLSLFNRRRGVFGIVLGDTFDFLMWDSVESARFVTDNNQDHHR
jgi:hypothetical protein